MSCAVSTSGLGGGRTYSSARAQRNMSDVSPCMSTLHECAMAPTNKSPQKVPVTLRPSAAWFTQRRHRSLAAAKRTLATPRTLPAAAWYKTRVSATATRNAAHMNSSVRSRKAVRLLRVSPRCQEEVVPSVAVTVADLGFKKHGTW